MKLILHGRSGEKRPSRRHLKKYTPHTPEKKKKSNFQLSVDNNPGLFWFWLTLLSDWSRKLAPSSQPIRYKTKNKRGMVNRVFPRFKQLACFNFEFSLANDDVNLSLSLELLWFWFFRRWIETVWTQSRPRLFFELQQLTIHLEFWDFNDSSMLLYRKLRFTVSISLFKIRFNVPKRVLWIESTAFLLLLVLSFQLFLPKQIITLKAWEWRAWKYKKKKPHTTCRFVLSIPLTPKEHLAVYTWKTNPSIFP